MEGKGRKLAVWGCGVLVLGAMLVAGALTWYSGRLGGAYRQVKESEKALVAATQAFEDWAPPPGNVPDPARLEVFAGVRESLAEWRQRLASDSRRLAGGDGKGWARAGNAADLAEAMAEYWVARNEALTKASLGPGEYVWLYGLVYYGWLGHDPAAGRLPGTGAGGAGAASIDERFDSLRSRWRGGVGDEALAALTPLRARLEAGWTEDINPVELMFLADGTPEAGR